MSCDGRSLVPLLAVLALLALVPLGGCGKKGPPLPPLRYVPETTRDLTVAQRGRELIFEMAFPTRTTDETPLPDLRHVELWVLEKPAAAEGTPEPVTARELEAAAELVETLSGRDLAQATVGGRLVFHTPLPEAEGEVEPVAEPVAEEPVREEPVGETATGEPGKRARRAFFFSVRSVVSERDTSAFSNQAVIVPLPPPPAPTGLRVAATAEGIEVSWTSPGPEALPGGVPPEGFHVYRRDPRSRFWGDPLELAGPSATRYLDTGARFGEGYVYTVTTVTARDPLIESAPGGAREIEYRDRFAPPPPENPVALPEAGRVRLVWDASAAPDVAGYYVYRRQPGEELERITGQPISGREYLDRGLVPGTVLTYRITAVDAAGNESDPSAEVTAEVR
jgi:predicted small lipoprotein YifL